MPVDAGAAQMKKIFAEEAHRCPNTISFFLFFFVMRSTAVHGPRLVIHTYNAPAAGVGTPNH